MKNVAALFAFALAAACAPTATEAPASATAAPATPAAAQSSDPWANAHTAGIDFRAIGQEPGWLLEIDDGGRMTLQYDYGEHRADFATPDPSYPQEFTTVYEARAGQDHVHVTIRRAPCQDSMSGENFPASVTIRINDRTLEGCGKSP